MHILLFILIFIIAIFVFGLSIVGFILRTIFGLGRSSSSSRPKQTESGRTSQQSYNQTNRRSNDDEEEIYSENVPEKRHKKIFTQDDGEYVDLRKSNSHYTAFISVSLQKTLSLVQRIRQPLSLLQPLF